MHKISEKYRFCFLALGMIFSLCFVRINEVKCEDSLHLKKAFFITENAILYTGSMSALATAWYKGYEKSSFHFFNDNKEWEQIDKFGHSYTGYLFSNVLSRQLQATGVSKRKSVLTGAGLSWFYMSSIEFFDGFSAKWGASYGDLLANTAGCFFYAGQELLWEEQKVLMKYSYHKSPYMNLRPEAFGNGPASGFFKDYNGQSYWLSANISSFTNSEYIPKWLCFSIGYGIDGVIGGEENPSSVNGFQTPYYRRRICYLSLDVDFTKFNVRNKYLKSLLVAINSLKVPFPALIISKHSLRTELLYY